MSFASTLSVFIFKRGNFINITKQHAAAITATTKTDLLPKDPINSPPRKGPNASAEDSLTAKWEYRFVRDFPEDMYGTKTDIEIPVYNEATEIRIVAIVNKMRLIHKGCPAAKNTKPRTTKNTRS